MTESIYLNYAATSQQKPSCVIEAVCHYLQKNNEAATHRSLMGLEEAGEIFDVREQVAAFFHVTDAARVIFTAGITMSLNMVLNGLLKAGDHVITTSVEHNAVARPLHLLSKEKQVTVTVLPCRADGTLFPEQVEAAIQANTKALIMTQASNVLGTILPVAACFEIAKRHELFTILDSAQGAGSLPVDMEKMAIDVLTFTGHKGLLGLAGIGGLALSAQAADQITPWLVGGTGSRSNELNQPFFLPDKLEAGTPNLTGIISLGSSIQWLQKKGIATIRTSEEQRTKQFLEGLTELPVRILGTRNAQDSVSVVSLTSSKLSSGQLAQRLFDEYQIITRCGLHCAPWAHQTAGTLEGGTVRFSFGWATTATEIDYTLIALKQILA